MIHHYITRYMENGKRYAEAWLQLNIFGLSWCFSKRRIELADEQPAMDAEPVRHGRWLRLDEAPERDQRRCSECGDISCCQRNYCPNCGARMDGDGDAR